MTAFSRFIAPVASSYAAASSDDGTMISSQNATGPASGWAAASLGVSLPAVGSVSVGWTMIGATDANNAVVFQAPLAAPPAAPVLSQVSGGTLLARTNYVKITYVNLAGETLGSAEASLAIGANNLLQVASPGALGNATGWNVYVGTASGNETKQNAAQLSLASSWTQPTGGLIAGAAPPVTATAPSAYVLVDGSSFNQIVVGPANYLNATIVSDGTNYRVFNASPQTLAINGANGGFPARFTFPGGPGYGPTLGDGGNWLCSAGTGSGLAVTLPPAASIPAGWTLGLPSSPFPITVTPGSGNTVILGTSSTTSPFTIAQGETVAIQFDGAVFRVVAYSALSLDVGGHLSLSPYSLFVKGTTVGHSPTTGAAIVAGDMGIGGGLNIQGGLTLFGAASALQVGGGGGPLIFNDTALDTLSVIALPGALPSGDTTNFQIYPPAPGQKAYLNVVALASLSPAGEERLLIGTLGHGSDYIFSQVISGTGVSRNVDFLDGGPSGQPAFTMIAGSGSASFNGAIAGTTLTASSVSGTIAAGQVVLGSVSLPVAGSTFIVQQLTGAAGGAGTYKVSTNQTVAVQPMTSGAPPLFAIYQGASICSETAAVGVQQLLGLDQDLILNIGVGGSIAQILLDKPVVIAGALVINGTASATKVTATNLGFNATFSGITDNGLTLTDTAGHGGTTYEQFISGVSTIGSIKSNGASTAILYNTTSDERLKNDLGPYRNAAAVLGALTVHDFTWLDSGEPDVGLFAQEAALVKPSAVTQGGDDPRVEPAMIDLSKYVPDLIAGWQEHEKTIAELRRCIEELEGV